MQTTRNHLSLCVFPVTIGRFLAGYFRSGFCALVTGLVALSGCSQDPQAAHNHPHNQSHTHAENRAAKPQEDFALPEGIDASRYTLAEEPEGAQEVIVARETAQNDEDIVIVGRIGGGEQPWVEGRAAFSVVDNSLKACSDIPGDDCPVPWDYCCETHKLPESTVLVTIVDEAGNTVKADARALLDVKELSTVVVRGKAKRDDAGNLLVLASGVYVRSM